MRNIGIQWILNANIDNFTSAYGIVVRKWIGKPFRYFLRHAPKKPVVQESYPKLKNGIPYIFVSTHSFVDDVASGLGCLDRNAYLLNGATEAIKHNPQMYAAWVNGTIYVDRQSQESRRNSVDKMKRVIEAGSSVFLYPEGGWNNSENRLCNPLFSGCFSLAKDMGVEIVPICTYTDEGLDKIYFNASEPIDVSGKEKDEALREVRDALATMVYNAIEKHGECLKRANLSSRSRHEFMESRYRQYMESIWTKDTWEEELTVYCDRRYPSPELIRSTMKSVKITKQNAHIMAPILAEIEEDERYDFKQFMHMKWKQDNQAKDKLLWKS